MEPLNLYMLPFRNQLAIKGEIYDTQDPDVLLQDLLEIDLPRGRTIDVGWYPEHDPTGAYRIRMYEDAPIDFIREESTAYVGEVLKIVSQWIRLELEGFFVTSASEDTVKFTIQSKNPELCDT